MGKGLIDPMTGDRVLFEKRYIGDEYDAPAVEFGKAGVFIPGGILTNLSTGKGRTREDSAVSHANRVSHTRNRGASARDGRLHRIKHGGRSHSGTSIGKMFSETGHGVGRRLIEI